MINPYVYHVDLKALSRFWHLSANDFSLRTTAPAFLFLRKVPLLLFWRLVYELWTQITINNTKQYAAEKITKRNVYVEGPMWLVSHFYLHVLFLTPWWASSCTQCLLQGTAHHRWVIFFHVSHSPLNGWRSIMWNHLWQLSITSVLSYHKLAALLEQLGGSKR